MKICIKASFFFFFTLGIYQTQEDTTLILYLKNVNTSLIKKKKTYD